MDETSIRLFVGEATHRSLLHPEDVPRLQPLGSRGIGPSSRGREVVAGPRGNGRGRVTRGSTDREDLENPLLEEHSASGRDDGIQCAGYAASRAYLGKARRAAD